MTIKLTAPGSATGRIGELNVLRGISVRREGLEATDDSGRSAWQVFPGLFTYADIRHEAGSQSHTQTYEQWIAGRQGLDAFMDAVANTTNSRTHSPAHLKFGIRACDSLSGGASRVSPGNEPPHNTGEGKMWDDPAAHLDYYGGEERLVSWGDLRKTFIQTAHAYQYPNGPDHQLASWEAVKRAIADGGANPGGIATTRKCFGDHPDARGYAAMRRELEKYHTQMMYRCRVWFCEWNARRAAANEGTQATLYMEMLLVLSRLYYETGQIEALHYHEGFNAKESGCIVNLNEDTGAWEIGPLGSVYEQMAGLLMGRWANLEGERPDKVSIEGFVANKVRYLAWSNLLPEEVTCQIGDKGYHLGPGWGVMTL